MLYAECNDYAECRYTECRGAQRIPTQGILTEAEGSARLASLLR